MSSDTSVIKKVLLWKLNIIAVVIMCCFANAQQSVRYVAEQTLNCVIKVKNICYTLVEQFHYLVKTKYVLWKIHYQYWELFVGLFVVLSICTLYLKFCCIFSESFLCMQIKLALFSPEIVSALENKELQSHFRVYGKCATSTQTDRRIAADESLYTGSINC